MNSRSKLRLFSRRPRVADFVFLAIGGGMFVLFAGFAALLKRV